ncbi:dynamin GTPase [Trifolium repens]|nr:dynamin GTPase [Trifolium repens]
MTSGKKKNSTKATTTVNQHNESSSSLALVHVDDDQPQRLSVVAPIVSSYNEKIRPVLDALENLRRLNIAKEGIQLPTIVVVGDQSSGKSSVLESLAGISLPRGQDKSIVGIPVLAQKLVHVQAMIISKTLPEIIKKINEKLANNLHELKHLPANLSSLADAMSAFLQIISMSRESLRKILLIGDYKEYPEEKQMHCTARLVEMLNSYASDLQNCDKSIATEDFLMDEIKVLEEAKCIGLPNFMPKTAFLTLLQRKVGGISDIPIGFIDSVWNYLETIVTSVLKRHCENYYQLQVSTRRAAENLIVKKKKNSIQYVLESVEMEKHTDYTCNPEYMQEYNKLVSHQEAFLKEVLNANRETSTVNLEGVGDIEVNHMMEYHNVLLTQAFDLKARLISYWKIVVRRLIDVIALHLMLSINKLVNIDLEKEIFKELSSSTGGGVERLLEESPSISGKREKLNRSVKVLRESKETVANIMDRIGVYATEEIAGSAKVISNTPLTLVTANDVNIGLGYAVCVRKRNRIGDESFEEARLEKQKLFESHSLLSKVDKSIVGIPVLAQMLVEVQTKIKSVMNAEDVDFAVDKGIEEVDEVAEEEDVSISKIRTKRNTKLPSYLNEFVIPSLKKGSKKLA